MIKYELFKCQYDINDMPKKYWENGMVYQSEYQDAKRVASFTTKEQGLEELGKYECSATYLGGIGKVTRAVEYWLEENEYDKDGEFFQTIDCYVGKYPIVEKRKARKVKMKKIEDLISTLDIKADVLQILIKEYIKDENDMLTSSDMDLLVDIQESLDEVIEKVKFIKENLSYIDEI